MVPIPPAAPVSTMRRDFVLAILRRSFCKPAIALERTCEMVAHGAPRLDRITGGDAGNDAAVLLLDALEIGTPLGRRIGLETHVLARNDVAAKEGEEAR